MLGFGPPGQFPLGGGPFAAATITTIGWFAPLSEPVRFKRGLAPQQQQFLAFNPQPVVSFSWFAALSEPVRQRPRSPAALYPSHFLQPAPSPFVATGWFMPLSEPVRQKPRSPAAMSPAFFLQPAPSPFVATGWFAALSEPVRQKPGLRAHLQMAYAGPSQLRPNPAISGVLAALETKDIFLAGGMEWTTVTSGEVGITTNDFSGAEIGIAGPAITSVQVSIRIV
jgi:hypothetical protein